MSGAAKKQPVIRDGLHLRGQVDYADIDAINYSSLKEMAKSPKHYQHYLRNGRTATSAMNKGTAAHIAILEPARFVREYAVFDGPRRAGKAWDAFVEANAGKEILKEDEFNTAMAMRDAVRSDPTAAAYLRDGHHEVTMVWTDEETRLRCKGRADFIRNDNVIVDVKTTRNLEPFWFGRDCARLQYHVQAAFYTDGLESIVKSSVRYVVIAVESAPPHDVVVYTVGESVIDAGRAAYRGMLKRVIECRRDGTWPGYSSGLEVPLALPNWALGDDGDEDVELVIGGESISF